METVNEPFGAYTLKDVAADSKAAIEQYKDRLLLKLARANEKLGHKLPHLIIAVGATLPVLIGMNV